MISAGKCREMVSIERPEKVVSIDGAESVSWRWVGLTSIEIEPQSAKEAWTGETVSHVVTHSAKCRWMPNLTPDCRLVNEVRNHDGSRTVYAIAGLWDVDGKRREMALSLSAERLAAEAVG